MKLFVFSSINLTNIWAGIGAELWAVSIRQKSGVWGIRTRSQQMQIGSIGLLYCSDTKTLTTPFIVYSSPDLEKEISNVWPEIWVLPFRIHALGNPNKQLHKDEAKKILPTFERKRIRNISHELKLAPTTVFVPSDISEEDWKVIIEQLAI